MPELQCNAVHDVAIRFVRREKWRYMRGFSHLAEVCQMSFKTAPLLSLKNDPPLLSPSRGSGSVKIPKIHPPFYLSSGSIPEAPALIAGLNNFAVMR